ncbi:MAG: septum formation initiator family protein [Pseudomonadota bacterium]
MLATRQKRRTRLRYFIVPVLSVGCLSYFAHHAYEGTYGLRSSEALSERALQLKTELAELSSKRERLEWQVKLLEDGSIERDMIDERARAVLGVAGPRDVLILR